MQGRYAIFRKVHAKSDNLYQQHGSVYWSNNASTLLSDLDASQSLAEQLVPKAFSSLKAPIWQDSSTTDDCKRLEDEYGGAQAVADRSGSRAYERFTGPQISRVGATFTKFEIVLKW